VQGLLTLGRFLQSKFLFKKKWCRI